MPHCQFTGHTDHTGNTGMKPYLAHTPQPDDPPPGEPDEPDGPPIGDPPPEPFEASQSNGHGLRPADPTQRSCAV